MSESNEASASRPCARSASASVAAGDFAGGDVKLAEGLKVVVDDEFSAERSLLCGYAAQESPQAFVAARHEVCIGKKSNIAMTPFEMETDDITQHPLS
jgi:hypothetical protein